ncbi:hypothetical protein [Kitasatospora griseola]|uniref:hypothetical protein n=1 Tax=Kitasatospora griseola TaxID=2064 RepID=UPI00382019BD
MNGRKHPPVHQQKKSLKRIEAAAKRDSALKDLPTETIDKIMAELKDKGAYCTGES